MKMRVTIIREDVSCSPSRDFPTFPNKTATDYQTAK